MFDIFCLIFVYAAFIRYFAIWAYILMPLTKSFWSKSPWHIPLSILLPLPVNLPLYHSPSSIHWFLNIKPYPLGSGQSISSTVHNIYGKRLSSYISKSYILLNVNIHEIVQIHQLLKICFCFSYWLPYFSSITLLM